MNILWYKRIPFPRSSIATGMHDLSSLSHGSFHTLTNTVYFRGPTNFKVFSAVIVYMHVNPPSYRKNLPLLKVHAGFHLGGAGGVIRPPPPWKLAAPP